MSNSFAPVSSIEYLVSRHLASLRRSRARKAQIAFEALLHHEFFHFISDYAVAQWELLLKEPIWARMANDLAKRNRYLEIEEKLANAYMLRTIRSSYPKAVSGALEKFVACQPSGYRHAVEVESDSDSDFYEELPEHLNHYIGLYAAKYGINVRSDSFDAGVFYPTLPRIDSRDCPIHLIHDEYKTGLSAGAYRLIQCIRHIEESKRFRKSFRKLLALFDVNTGLRSSELCGLRWSWEVKVPELETSVFILPEEMTKNGEERIVVLNRIARSVLESQRGEHRQYVFTYCGGPLLRVSNHGWRRARLRADLPLVRFHDLRHTFGHRLRAAGVSFEDRQDLLGHRSGRITTHYSAPDIARLLAAANSICEPQPSTVLRIVRPTAVKNPAKSGKIPAVAAARKSSARASRR